MSLKRKDRISKSSAAEELRKRAHFVRGGKLGTAKKNYDNLELAVMKATSGKLTEADREKYFRRIKERHREKQNALRIALSDIEL